MPFEEFQKYTMAIACGKYKPKKNAPKIWFESIETSMQVLSTKNIRLLELIKKEKPASIEELARLSGRNKSNLSRTLKTFYKYQLIDFVEKNRRKRPIALATKFDIQIGRSIPNFIIDAGNNSQGKELIC